MMLACYCGNCGGVFPLEVAAEVSPLSAVEHVRISHGHISIDAEPSIKARNLRKFYGGRFTFVEVTGTKGASLRSQHKDARVIL